MNRHDSFEWTVDTLEEDDVDVLIEYIQTQASYAGCGPSFSHPGDPPEPPEWELKQVTRLDTAEVLILTTEAQQKVDDAILEHIQNQEESSYGY